MIVKATMENVMHVVENMQAIERKAIEATHWEVNNESIASGFIKYTNGLSYCALSDSGEPVVVGGLNFITPSVAQAQMFGTDKWCEVYKEVTKATRQVMDQVLNESVKRIQVRSLAEHHIAHKWYEKSLDMRLESKIHSYGKNGEDFVMYYRLRR